MSNMWERDEAEARIHELLDAAKTHGPQTVIDRHGTYAIVFSRRRPRLEALFSRPGPLKEDDLET